MGRGGYGPLPRIWPFSAPSRVTPFDLKDRRMLKLAKPSFSTPSVSEMRVPFAQVPIALCKHKSDPSKINKAFLWVIVPFAKQSGALWMHFFYVDVRAETERLERSCRTIRTSSARM